MELRPHLLFTAVLSIALLAPAASAGAASQAVSMNDNVFSPANIQVDPGDTVTWTNKGVAEHTATSRAGAPAPFDSGLKPPGQSYSFTFQAPGRYAFYCQPHEILGMQGVVQVGPDNTPPKVTGVKVKRGKKSVKVTFKLNEEARVKATFRRGKKKIKTVTTKLLDADTHSVSYKKRLASGSYSVTLVATDAAKNASKAVKKSFRVPKR